jgi:hypothetical protein
MNILFLLFKARANKSGEAPIMMRLSQNNKRITFSTGLFTDPKIWDQDKQVYIFLSNVKWGQLSTRHFLHLYRQGECEL